MVVLDPPFGLNKASWDKAAMTPYQLVSLWEALRVSKSLQKQCTLVVYCQPWELGPYRTALLDKCAFSNNFQVRVQACLIA